MSNSPDDDWALLASARQARGRESRIRAGTLVGRLRPKAYALAFRLLQDAAQAEDVVQESLLRLWKSHVMGNGQAQLSTYFHQIVIHESMRILSRRGREMAVDQESLIELADQQYLEQSDAAAEHTCLASEMDLAALEQALGRLPDRQRAALVLWAFADAGVGQIAGQLQIAENAAHQLLHRAKQSLKKQLGVIA